MPQPQQILPLNRLIHEYHIQSSELRVTSLHASNTTLWHLRSSFRQQRAIEKANFPCSKPETLTGHNFRSNCSFENRRILCSRDRRDLSNELSWRFWRLISRKIITATRRVVPLFEGSESSWWRALARPRY
jgi:hypothetical protein